MNAQKSRTFLQRKNLIPATLLLLPLVIIIVGVASSTAQSPAKEEREIADRIPQHLPIKIKIRNPEKAKDLKNEDWLSDLEIEVKNTGDKPIYFLYITVILPDTKHDETGNTIGYQLWYGRQELIDLQSPIISDDVPIRPGESCVLRVNENSARGWKRFRAEKNIAAPKKLEIHFQLINFGDGTGFGGTDGIPMPFSKDGSDASCREGPAASASSTTRATRIRVQASVDSLTSLSSPINFLPTSFEFPSNDLNPTPEPPAARDICCPSGVPSSCWFAKQGFYTCQCGTRPSLNGASCSDPQGRCTITD